MMADETNDTQARIEALEAYAREASIALTWLSGGGSEMFKRIGDEFYADPELCKRRAHEQRQNRLAVRTEGIKALEAENARLRAALSWTSAGNPPEMPGTYLAFEDTDAFYRWHFGHWDGKRWLSGDDGTPIKPTHWRELGPRPSDALTIPSPYTMRDEDA